jgi:hypothetical protein
MDLYAAYVILLSVILLTVIQQSDIIISVILPIVICHIVPVVISHSGMPTKELPKWLVIIRVSFYHSIPHFQAHLHVRLKCPILKSGAFSVANFSRSREIGYYFK